MKRLFPTTAILLLIAGAWNAILFVSAFVVHIPIRADSHNLVRTASGAYTEVAVHPQTYFQKYGFAELLLVGLGLVLTLVVALALRRRAAESAADAGKVAWRTSVACAVLGVIGFVTIAPYLLIVGVLLVVACRAFAGSVVAARRAEVGPNSLTMSTPH